MLKSLVKKYVLTPGIFRYLIIIIYGVLSLFLIAAADNSEKNFPATLPSIPDQASVAPSNTPSYVIIRPSDQVTFSSETAASVAAINVKEGSQFHAGEVLLTLDCRLQQAELNKATAQRNESKMARESAKKLKAYGSISEFELVKAVSDDEIAGAEVDKLKAIVEKCTIKSPFNGGVAELMVHSHESVKPGDPLLKIVSTDNLEFEMQVPSCWLSWLKVGTNFNVHINETDKTILAKITKINPQIEPISQTVKVLATITPANPTLRPGMSGQAIFPDNVDAKCAQGTK
jgi:RND family efflux transporter MFP subunit